jgi:hypothetical protein
MAREQVVVVLAEGADAAHVVSDLRAHGLSVESSDAELGFVAGSCEESSIERLRAVAGVAGIERGRRFQLPDPSRPQ